MGNEATGVAEACLGPQRLGENPGAEKAGGRQRVWEPRPGSEESIAAPPLRRAASCLLRIRSWVSLIAKLM